MGKRELIALLNLSSWCLVMVERLFLAVPRGCLQFVIVVFPDHTHLLFLTKKNKKKQIDIVSFQIYQYYEKNHYLDLLLRYSVVCNVEFLSVLSHFLS